MDEENDNQTTALKSRHRTTPLPESLTPVPGYPRKLTIYKLAASPYWWVRYYVDGKILRRSTKTEDKNQAFKFAKAFFDEITVRKTQGLAVSRKSRFDVVTNAMQTAQKAQVARGEVTEQTYINANYRFTKTILPFFEKHDVADVNYDLLEQFLNTLSHHEPKLSLSTIDSYMKLVRKVLNYAHKRGLINGVCHFPTVSVPDNPRAPFTAVEYRVMRFRARSLSGKRFDVRMAINKQGEEDGTIISEAGTSKLGRKIRSIEITDDLYELVVFMVNSFIRPTDIKNMQHRHVEVVSNGNEYLRLNLPTSKKHDTPIVTMNTAVVVYQRLTEKNKARGWGVEPNDYVFLPQLANRDYALKQLQRQFDVLMWSTQFGEGPKGEPRTIYSLRHTCIMFRLTKGEKMDVVTLARNARTSPEMINRFYASKLQPEDNIDMLQSRRQKKLKSAPNV